MSNYSSEPQKPTTNIHNEKIVNSRLANPNTNAATDLVNNKKTVDGVDLLYPKSTILSSTFNGSNPSIPVKIVADTSNKSKDVHFDALLDSNESQLTTDELKDSIIHDGSGNNIGSTSGPNITYKNDFMTQFYVGSLTVVGLFIFFRVVQKSK